MGTEYEEELAKRQQAIQGELNRQQAAQRAKDLADFQRAEAAKKAAEEAAKKSNMIVAEPAAPSWPDDGFEATPSRTDGVKGALRIGEAGDAAFVRDLLYSGQAPLGSATLPAKGGVDSAKEKTGGAVAPAAKPALGL